VEIEIESIRAYPVHRADDHSSPRAYWTGSQVRYSARILVPRFATAENEKLEAQGAPT
jgi:hypothetical protein